jgi:hypothetical protein
MFSGAALLMHLLTGATLRASLAFTSAAALVAGAAAWRRAPRDWRPVLRRTASAGAVAGVLATVAYDASKWALSGLDPSPYNPFEVLGAFGALLLGPQASAGARLAAGAGLHALNGTCFGVAFALLFGGKGARAGVAWGLFLELFQLTLYPGWLDIRLYREFAMISSLGHVVYGLVLGAGTRRLLARPDAVALAVVRGSAPPVGIHRP